MQEPIMLILYLFTTILVKSSFIIQFSKFKFYWKPGKSIIIDKLYINKFIMIF